MGRPSKLTDEMLQSYVDSGVPQKQIAFLCNVSESAISQRVAALERKRAAHADPEAFEQARISVWNVRQKLEWAQAQAEALFNETYNPMERIAALNLLNSQMRFAMSALSTLYSIEEQAAFQDEVLAILDEFDPHARETIIERLNRKRPIRAALLSGGGTLPTGKE